MRLTTDALGIITHENPSDPFRRQVKVVRDGAGSAVEAPFLVNTWEREVPGVIEAIDPDAAGVDPLQFLKAEEAN